MVDTTLLSWISTEVDQALSLVRDRIAKYTSGPQDDAVLQPCPEHLHQVSGALRMVGLSGATRFCEAIEGGLRGLNGSDRLAAVGVIDHAVLALKQFVDDLAHGKANVPLRLYPAYCEIARLQGQAAPSEKDLFFPDAAGPVPSHAEPLTVPQAKLGAYLSAQRARLQRGVLGWLRSQPGGLADMREALEAMHRISAQLPEPRALWWSAVALVEALQDEPAQDWAAAARVLCNKLDLQIRDLASGAQKGNDGLLRDILYALAKSPSTALRVREAKQLYGLDAQFPAAVGPELDLDRLQPALSDLRSRLEALKAMWLQYVAGEPKSVVRFRELIASFRAKADELGSSQLVRLLDAMALVASKLPETHPQQHAFMIIEMASAFLLVESIVETFPEPTQDLEEQIAIMGGWLLDAAKGRASGEPPAGLHAELSRRIGAMQLRAQVAKEILTNLHHVEQVLDAYARDPAKRDTLPGLEPYLRQIHGALVVLGLEQAAEVLSICERMIGAQSVADHPEAAQDMDWIAEGLSSLGFLLDPCVRGGEPAEQALRIFFRRYGERRAAQGGAAEPSAPPLDIVPDLVLDLEPKVPAADQTIVLQAPIELEAPPAAAAPAERPTVNQELLEIYLDEAGEVLEAINASLPECRAQPQNRDSLTTIRRGFHTLKGSGRMVGLMDLGEVAWEIEQVMNRWLEQQRPASAKLLELITLATSAFAVWVGQLREGSLKGEIEAGAIVDLARRLKSSDITEPPPAPPAQQEPEEVLIGGVCLGRSMYEIYLNEAQGHAASLREQCASWMGALGAEPSHEFLRAAHTLASSSRTAGFAVIADLAGAVEQWIPFARQVVRAEDAAPAQAAVERLARMVEALARAEDPGSGAAEAQALLALTERLQAEPPPVESKAEQTLSLDLSGISLDLDIPAPEAPQALPEKAKETAPAPGREQRRMQDDIDEQLLPIFLEEAQELLPQIGSDIRDWKAAPADPNVVQSLQRGLHTLKGSARMAGAIRLGELTHQMESLVEAALEANRIDEALFAELEEKMDRLSLDVERMQAGPAQPAPAVEEAKEKAQEPAKAKEQEQPVEPAPSAVAGPGPKPAAPAKPARAEAPLPSPAAMLRINADTLDHLINEAGEVSIARSRVEAELRTVKQTLGDLSESIARLRTQLREVEVQADSQMQSRRSELEERGTEFDPLEFDRYTRLQELTRLMAESLHDVMSIQQALMKNLGDSDAALLQQARTTREVQQQLMRMRAVPFSNLNERLYRVVRQTAREVDKKAELAIEGGQVELDRSVLEKIAAPLEHMLRNSLAHGIETPQARLAAAKAEAGRIAIALRQEGNEISLVVSDDGAGLDLDRLYRKAVERGIIEVHQPLTDAEKAQLIFASGLSTAEQVSELAGRGVGMDVVRNDITSIGGRIDISSERGKGTSFAIYLPLTLAVTQVVMVRAAGTRMAIPASMVENVLRLKSDAMAGLYDRRVIEIQDRSYPLHYLQQLLGSSGATDIQPYNSVLLLRSGIQRVAVHVDELIGNQEIVVKNIGPQLARVPGVAGATVLADGSIVLIANPVQLAQHARLAPQKPPAAAAPAVAAEAATAAPGSAPVIMVVDDSLTVRKITSRLLEREGYQVLTAKDGVDALQQLKDAIPAVMLVDIEMPRMDGFDLAKNVRADPRTAGIPIVIISSRTADKHRNQAAQLGVNAFLGKPYQEAELLQHVASFVAAVPAADITSRLH